MPSPVAWNLGVQSGWAGRAYDLVLNEPLVLTDDIRRASRGLVLTEWKVVKTEAELEAKAKAAHKQAIRYDQGILAGFPVAFTRYLVMVSPGHLNMPLPWIEGDVTFEYRNIAVKTATPSMRNQ